MRVALFISCLVDQCWPAAGEATVRVLRRAGCRPEFDPRQTCCGQPAWNAGCRDDAAAVVRHALSLFSAQDPVPIVVPSGSCAAMIRRWPEVVHGDPAQEKLARNVADRTFELGEFLVRRLGVEDLGARFPGRLAWHHACHGLRDLGLRTEGPRLLARVRDAEILDVPASDACCGFGGTFSVAHPELSVSMADLKIDALEAAGADAVVSGDVGCLLQLGGRLSRRGSRVRPLHLSEVLAAGGD